MAFTGDGIENLKDLISSHKVTPSIIEKRRQALAAMRPSQRRASDQTANGNLYTMMAGDRDDVCSFAALSIISCYSMSGCFVLDPACR